MEMYSTLRYLSYAVNRPLLAALGPRAESHALLSYRGAEEDTLRHAGGQEAGGGGAL